MKLRESLEALTQKWLKNGHLSFSGSLLEAFDVPLSELEAELAAARDREKAAIAAALQLAHDTFQDEYCSHDDPLLGVIRGLKAIRSLITPDQSAARK